MRKRPYTLYLDIKPNNQEKLIKRKIQFVTDGCRHYHNAQHLLIELTTGERAFYDYLCEHSDEKNRIMIDHRLKIEFSGFVSQISSKRITYSEKSAAKYILKLCSLGLILKTGSTKSGFYVVNPKYAFKGTEKSRALLLEQLIYERITKEEDVAPLIDVPVEEFLGTTDTKLGAAA